MQETGQKIALLYLLGTHKAGGIVLSIGVGALDGEMDLVLTEALVDGVNGLHESFLTRAVFDLLRRKEVQLHTAIGLQLGQEHAGLFILIARLIETLEQQVHRMYDSAGVVGRCGQFDSVIGVVLRKVRSMAVSG